MEFYFLDCRFRGSDTLHPVLIRTAGLSTARERRVASFG